MASSSHGAVAGPPASHAYRGAARPPAGPSCTLSLGGRGFHFRVSPLLGSTRQGLGPTEPVWCWAWGGGPQRKAPPVTGCAFGGAGPGLLLTRLCHSPPLQPWRA